MFQLPLDLYEKLLQVLLLHCLPLGWLSSTLIESDFLSTLVARLQGRALAVSMVISTGSTFWSVDRRITNQWQSTLIADWSVLRLCRCRWL